MEEIKLWALCVCGVSIGGAIFYFLLPEGSVSRTARSVLSAVMLAVLFLPLFQFGKNSVNLLPEEIPVDDGTAQAWQAYSMLAQNGEDAVRGILLEVVERHCAGGCEIEFDTDILSDGSIDIKQVRLVLYGEPFDTTALQAELSLLVPASEIVFAQEVDLPHE